MIFGPWLVERDPDALVVSPGHPAVVGRVAARDHQPEVVWNADLAGDFELGTRIRYIPDGAVDDAAIELDRSCLQYPVPGRHAVIIQNLKRFRFCGLCFLRRLVLQQPIGVQRRGLDGLLGQRRPDPGPGKAEADLAVLEIDGGSPVIGGRRQAVDRARPPPVRAVHLLHDPSDRETAPDHFKVVVLAGAADDGGPQRDGFQIVGRHRMSLIRFLKLDIPLLISGLSGQ